MDTEKNQEEIVEEVVEQAEEVVEEPTGEVQEEVIEAPKEPELSEYEKGKRYAEFGAKKSIAKEVSKRKRLELQYEQLLAQNQEILDRFDSMSKPARPKYEDFANAQDPDYEYQKAMYEHLNSDSTKSKKKPSPQKKIDIDENAEQRYIAKEQVFMSKNSEYLENKANLAPFLQGNPALIDALHEAGPEVVNYLGENLDLADDLNSMSPVQMGRMLAKIENDMKPAEKPTRQVKRPTQPPQAPRSKSRAVKDIGKMTNREYDAFMADPNNYLS